VERTRLGIPARVLVQRGNWATDIAYHLGTVLEIETRRAH